MSAIRVDSAKPYFATSSLVIGYALCSSLLVVINKSCAPLLVALADTAFRKLPIPSKLTFVSLLIILGRAIGYVATDLGFSSTAYS
ncbi:hypothetical protein DVH24_000752 [Malus domestica]|uniref:Sugar phosphate transporter domain-containing protein n=1 Tax=Malus domestica TaxID=3750 RepID=A0A498JZS5_MALDO|nr:hypothetical protein DVH24_000752 [Malus domestica]